MIIICDRSGSMSTTYSKIFNRVIPLFLDKINYPVDKEVHFITFDSFVEYRKINKNGFINSEEGCGGATYMNGIFKELVNIITDKNSCYRILTLSDVEIFDSEETSNSASLFYNKIKGKFKINSQVIRIFSSNYANPYILGLASVLQFNTIKQTSIIDINNFENEEITSEKIKQIIY